MNRCGIQQKNTFTSTCEEMRNSVTVSVSFENSDHMICPKPRRLSLFNNPINDPVRPLRLHMCYQQEPYESKASLELLEIIFEGSSSPPFFSGSPPSRVSNPLTQDTRFVDNGYVSSSGKSSSSSSSSSSMFLSDKKLGNVSGNFGNKPAVRIEGFDCLVRA